MAGSRDKFFKGQQTNEILICYFRHHWIVLLRELCYFAVFGFIIIYSLINIKAIQEVLRGNYEVKLLFTTIYLVGTFFMHRFFIKLINYFVNIGIITDIRIIDHKKTIFFRDTMDSIDMSQIQNIEKVQEGLLPSIFKYGDIKIFLNASDAVTTFHTVPNAKFHFRCINRQKEARLRQAMDRKRGSVKNNQNLNREPKITNSKIFTNLNSY